jgi:hypothetical protein
MRRMIVLLLLAAGCGEQTREERLLTAGVKSALEAPDKVKILRLDPGPFPKGEKVKTWPEVPTTTEVILDNASARELAGLLRNSRSYDFVAAKGCMPMPGVKVQITRNAAMLEAYLCFECLMLSFHGPGASGAEVWDNFDPMARKLSAIAKKAFPKDDVIQSIKY